MYFYCVDLKFLRVSSQKCLKSIEKSTKFTSYSQQILIEVFLSLYKQCTYYGSVEKNMGNNFAKKYATYCSSFPSFFESGGAGVFKESSKTRQICQTYFWRKAFVKLLEIPDIYCKGKCTFTMVISML